MRDPRRMPEVLAELEIEWRQRPDERFFQLVANLGDFLGYGKNAYQVEESRLVNDLIARNGEWLFMKRGQPFQRFHTLGEALSCFTKPYFRVVGDTYQEDYEDEPETAGMVIRGRSVRADY